MRLGGPVVFDGTAVTEFAIGQVDGDVIGAGFDAAGAMEPPEGFGERPDSFRGRAAVLPHVVVDGVRSGLRHAGRRVAAGFSGLADSLGGKGYLRMAMATARVWVRYSLVGPSNSSPIPVSGLACSRFRAWLIRPMGAATILGGSVGEWCRKEYGKPKRVQLSGAELRVLRVR